MTEADLVMEGGHAFVEGELLSCSISVRDGRIAGIHRDGSPVAARERRDVTGLLVLPGFIDSHVHLRDPGPTYKEDISTGTKAAAAGGFTLIADMPNCWPVTMGEDAIAAKAEAIDEKAYVDVSIWAAATSRDGVEAARMTGATGIKVFLNGPVGADPSAPFDPSASSFNPALTIRSYAQLLEIAEATVEAGLPLAVHLGEQSLLNRTRGHWAGRPFAEVLGELRTESSLEKRVAAAACLEITSETGAWLHFVHVPASVVPLALRARRQGLPVTLESFFPFMTFDLADRLGPLGFNRYKTQEEVDALWGWIRDGTIDLLASDHAPHLLEEKERGHEDILGCPSGYPELETSVAMMLTELAEGRVTIDILVERMSQAPARLLGLGHRKGRLAIGYDADFALVDPTVEWELGARPWETRSGWSPFSGRSVRGRVESTIVAGVEIYREGQIVGTAGTGSHRRRESARSTQDLGGNGRSDDVLGPQGEADVPSLGEVVFGDRG